MTKDRLRSSDALSGILFSLVGLAFLIGGRNLPAGSAARMGPGWFPIAVSGCLLLVGLVILARAFLRPGGEMAGFVWRPVLLICGALAVFALTLQPLGLALAIALSVVVAAYAHPPVALRRMLPYAALLGIGCSIVFVKWLGLQMPIVGSWLVPLLGRW